MNNVLKLGYELGGNAPAITELIKAL